MNNEQKKEYTAPKMEIIDCSHESYLLQASDSKGVEDYVGTTWEE